MSDKPNTPDIQDTRNIFYFLDGSKVDLNTLTEDEKDRVCFVCGIVPISSLPPKGWGCMHDGGQFYRSREVLPR